MTSMAKCVYAAALVAAMAFAVSARAGENGAPGIPKLDQQINQAVGSGDGSSSSSSDIDARVRDLESTRAAIDEKKPPAVSLSVSGWVSQQVQYSKQ